MNPPQVRVLGDGAFSGAAANIEGYNVSEYASPIDMNDLQGGVASISFGVVEDHGFDGSLLLPSSRIELSDSGAGTQLGFIDGITSMGETLLSVDAAGLLLPLVSTKSAAAFSGTLGQAVIYYCGLCGIDSGFQFDADLALIPVNLPSWTGEVWAQLKKLQAIHQFELVEVAGRIVMRKLRLRDMDVSRYSTTRFSYGRDDASQTVEVYYYNNEWKDSVQVYPDPESSIVDRSIISVGAGETSVTNVPVDMWISEIDPPTHVFSLPWDNTSTTSVYSVVDADGNPVSINDWANGGGLVSFAIGADGKSIDITVRGMITQSRAPYRIASSSQDLEYQYPALYIAATGVAFKQEMKWSATGASLDDAPADSVIRIDDPMISTPEEALVVLSNAALHAAGLSQTLEATTSSVTRRGETGQILYPTFAEFNAEHAGETFADFNASVQDLTFAEWTQSVADEVASDFANQAFGGVSGSRVRHRNAIYRVRNDTIRPGEYSFTAEHDVLFSDWNDIAGSGGLTFGEFNDTWAGKTFEQHYRMPLYARRWADRRRNYAVGPTASAIIAGVMKFSNGRWFGSGGGAGAYSLITDTTDGPIPEVTRYLRKTWTAAPTNGNVDTGFNLSQGAGTGTNSSGFPATPGQVWTLSGWLRSSSEGKTNARIQVWFHDSEGVYTTTTVAEGVPLDAGAWTRLELTFTVPEGAATFGAVIDVDGGTPWAIGDTLDGGGLLMELAGETLPYFDGDTTDVYPYRYEWDGAAYVSPSVMLEALPYS